MDVRRTCSFLILVCITAAPGCHLFEPAPSARVETLPPASLPVTTASDIYIAEPPSEASEPAAEEYSAVDQWVEQIRRRDDLRSRLGATPNLAMPPSPRAERPFEPRHDESHWSASSTPVPNDAWSVRESPTSANEDAARFEAAHSPERDAAVGLDDGALRAPVLTGLNAAPVRANTPAARSESDRSPMANAGQAARFGDSMDAAVAFHDRQPPGDNATFDEQLDYRLMAVLAGEYEQARQPLPLATSQQQAMASHLVETLIAVREGRGGDPSAETARVLRELDSLYEALTPEAELSIPKFVLCKAVRGFGQYSEIEPATFAAGVALEFVTYAEVRDFAHRQQDGGEYVSRFAMKTAVLNSVGDVVLELDDPDIVDRSRTRRRDCFIPRLVRLPAVLSPGQYVVKVTLSDKIAEKVAEARATFRVVARP